MKAVRIHRFGGPEVLQFDELPAPEPGVKEAVVRVRAAGVNPVDGKTRAGEFPPVGEGDLPVGLGRDLAGEVVRAGHDSGLQVGDHVLAHLGWDRGGYAEEVAVRPGEWTIKPDALGWEAAGALPLVTDTAWQGLFDKGGLQAGGRVLIHGGTGGVGHMAVQFARERGAWTAATGGGAEGVRFLRELGADAAVDYRSERFEDAAGDLDLVLDLIGGETRARSWALLKPGGRLVTTVHDGDVEAEGRAHAREGLAFMAHPSAAALRHVARRVAEGSMRVAVARTFPLDQVAEAQRFAEHEHPDGKVVLTV